jgi:hypothetical protein
MLAALEGFSQTIKLPGATSFLNNAQPLFFPLGEHMVGRVITQAVTVHCAVFLPKVCNMPLGLTWPTTTSFKDLYSSLKVLKGSYSVFLHVLQALQPQLTSWLAAIQVNPLKFTSPSFPLLEIHPAGFPTLNTGDYPDSILDP